MKDCTYYDIHAHLNAPQFAEDRKEVIARMREKAVWGNVIGVDYKSSREALMLASAEEHLFAVVGQHPVDTPLEEFVTERYDELLQHPKVVAVGECGFDFHHADPADESERTRQQKLFETQVKLAASYNKPLMIHARPSKGTMDAYEEVLTVLEPYVRKDSRVRGNVHFFVGTPKIARRFVAIGFSISFPGTVTFTDDYHEAVKAVPEEYIHAETDAPFAAPEPHRGKRNEPAYVAYVAEKLADIRSADPDAFRKQLVANARAHFNL